MMTSLRWALALSGITLSACGGGAGGACPSAAFTACGGDVQGTWNLVNECFEFDDPPSAECPEATVEAHTTASGSIVFRSDGTYSSSLLFGGELALEAPASCLDPGETCADLSDPADGTTCQGTDPCQCTTQLDDVTSEEEGDYATSGTSATLSPPLQLPRTVDYCVDGGTMLVRLPNTDPPIVLVFTR